MGVNLLLAKSLTLSLLVSVRFQFHFDDLPEQRSKGVGTFESVSEHLPTSGLVESESMDYLNFIYVYLYVGYFTVLHLTVW